MPNGKISGMIRPLPINWNQIVHVGAGSLLPMFLKIGEGVSELHPPPMQFPILNVHHPCNSVSTTTLHCDKTKYKTAATYYIYLM